MQQDDGLRSADGGARVPPAGLGLALLACSLVLAASLSNFLRFQDYPMLRPEVGLVAVGLLGFAVLVALAYRGQPMRGRAALEALLVWLAIELNGGRTLYAALAAAAVFAVVLYRRRSLLPVIATMAFFSLVLGLLGVGQAGEPSASARRPSAAAPAGAPALLHVILDEHVGVEGLPRDNPRSAAMKQALKDFYLRRGFRLFGRAYSEHMHTVNSIPHILALGGDRGSAPLLGIDGGAVPDNAYFSLLARQGYRLHVLQSDFIDYCGSPVVTECETYSSTSLRLISGSGLSTGEKAGLIFVRFLFVSPTLKTVGNLYNTLASRAWGSVALPHHAVDVAGRTSAVNALGAFDSLTETLRTARPGNAYFAHLLVPHYPYATTAGCEIKPVGDWMVRRSTTPRRLREEGYFDQLRCTMKKMDAALAAIQASPAGRNHIVVVHGDHGSRITTVEPIDANAGRIPAQDMVTGFSTLFAARGPGLAGGYEEAPAAASALLSQLSASGFRSAPVPAAAPASVVLDDHSWTPRRRVRLPASW